MGWTAIIEIIISILSMILEFLNGGVFPKPNKLTADVDSNYHLVHYQSQCSSPYWTEAATVKNGEFTGVVAVDCEVQGTSGGGIRALRKHFDDQVQTVSTAKGIQRVKSYEGLPALGQDVVVTMETDEQDYDIGAETTLASNGDTELRHVFQTTDIPKSGSLAYLRGVNNEVHVQATAKQHIYKVRFTYGSRIIKPWYVGSSTFRDVVAKKNEEKMSGRLQRMLNDLAANL